MAPQLFRAIKQFKRRLHAKTIKLDYMERVSLENCSDDDQALCLIYTGVHAVDLLASSKLQHSSQNYEK